MIETQSRKLFAATFIIVIIWTAIFCFDGILKMKKSNQNLAIKLSQDAYSSDPHKFDAFSHHILFGSVFAKLFSSYLDARVTEYLAESYTSDSGYKKWKFNVRKGLKFSNGDSITPKIIEKSLKRILLLAKRNNSNLPLLRKLSEAGELKNLDSKIKGIYSDNNALYMSFDEGEKNLPEILSFGLYGVAHPNDYDFNTLEWKAINPIASGPYYFKELNFEKKKFSLFLREDFPGQFILKNSPKIIEISTDSADGEFKYDLADGFQNEDHINDGYKFLGNTGADVFYMYVVKWDDPNNSLGSFTNRRSLRDFYEKKLVESGLKTTRSLFPLIHSGVEEVSLSTNLQKESLENIFKGKTFIIRASSKTGSDKEAVARKCFKEVLLELGAKLIEADVAFKEVRKHFDDEGYLGDRLSFAFRGTGIGNESPKETAEFMLSKEGIHIPDPRGVLHKLVQSENFDMNAFNKELYEDAILWPLIHTSFGYWGKENLDFSRFNLSLPLSEVHLIGIN